MSSSNLMMVLESCLAMQSWVNREYRRGLSTHPCGAPVLRISVADVATYPYHLGAARQEVQDPVAEVFSPRILSLVMSFEGTIVLNAEL